MGEGEIPCKVGWEWSPPWEAKEAVWRIAWLPSCDFTAGVEACGVVDTDEDQREGWEEAKFGGGERREKEWRKGGAVGGLWDLFLCLPILSHACFNAASSRFSVSN